MSGLLLVTLGCYQYVPTRLDPALPVGQDVRVYVTNEGARRLQLTEILPRATDVVEGELTRSDDTGIEVMVAVRDPDRAGFREQDIFQRLLIRSGEIDRLDLRRIDRGWTAVLVAVGVAGLAALVVGGLGGWVGGDTLPPPPEK